MLYFLHEWILFARCAILSVFGILNFYDTVTLVSFLFPVLDDNHYSDVIVISQYFIGSLETAS